MLEKFPPLLAHQLLQWLQCREKVLYHPQSDNSRNDLAKALHLRRNQVGAHARTFFRFRSSFCLLIRIDTQKTLFDNKFNSNWHTQVRTLLVVIITAKHKLSIHKLPRTHSPVESTVEKQTFTTNSTKIHTQIHVSNNERSHSTMNLHHKKTLTFIFLFSINYTDFHYNESLTLEAWSFTTNSSKINPHIYTCK